MINAFSNYFAILRWFFKLIFDFWCSFYFSLYTYSKLIFNSPIQIFLFLPSIKSYVLNLFEKYILDLYLLKYIYLVYLSTLLTINEHNNGTTKIVSMVISTLIVVNTYIVYDFIQPFWFICIVNVYNTKMTDK